MTSENSDDGRTAAPNCVFCDRIRNGHYIWEAHESVIFAPLNPVVPGHLLVVPRRHSPHFAWDLAASTSAMQAACLFVFQNAPNLDFNLITSKGAAATQTIQHLHLHLVPRYPDDGLTLPWTGQKK